MYITYCQKSYFPNKLLIEPKKNKKKWRKRRFTPFWGFIVLLFYFAYFVIFGAHTDFIVPVGDNRAGYED